MVFTLPIWFTPLVQALAYAYATWNGDVEERLIGWEGAGILALDVFLFHAPAQLSVEVLSLIVDLGVALSVALRSDKAWPVAYSAAAVAALLTAVAQIVEPVGRWAYVTALFVWIYLECLILVVAAWRARQARRALFAGAGCGV